MGSAVVATTPTAYAVVILRGWLVHSSLRSQLSVQHPHLDRLAVACHRWTGA